ncbi:MAG: hypothetical protein OXU23_18020 [Candidatus Poribacteria bacterium]|nr:hypothetical protein [Candidatus Poribacteria bacterium]
MSEYQKLAGPTKVATHNNTGVEKCESKEFDEGIAHFNNAIALDPTISVLYFNRAIAFNKIGFQHSALGDLSIVHALEPGLELPQF